jgi:hypothetical protein
MIVAGVPDDAAAIGIGGQRRILAQQERNYELLPVRSMSYLCVSKNMLLRDGTKAIAMGQVNDGQTESQNSGLRGSYLFSDAGS